MMGLPLFIGTTEMIFVLVVVLLVFGAKNIPEIARGFGKGMRQLKEATNEIKTEITKSAEDQGIDLDVAKDIKKEINKAKEGLDDLTGPIKRDF